MGPTLFTVILVTSTAVYNVMGTTLFTVTLITSTAAYNFMGTTLFTITSVNADIHTQAQETNTDCIQW